MRYSRRGEPSSRNCRRGCLRPSPLFLRLSVRTDSVAAALWTTCGTCSRSIESLGPHGACPGLGWQQSVRGLPLDGRSHIRRVRCRTRHRVGAAPCLCDRPRDRKPADNPTPPPQPLPPGQSSNTHKDSAHPPTAVGTAIVRIHRLVVRPAAFAATPGAPRVQSIARISCKGPEGTAPMLPVARPYAA